MTWSFTVELNNVCVTFPLLPDVNVFKRILPDVFIVSTQTLCSLQCSVCFHVCVTLCSQVCVLYSQVFKLFFQMFPLC